MYFLISFYFPGNAVLQLHNHFHLFYCITGIVIMCHFVHSLMAFVCQEIKGLLTYLLISYKSIITQCIIATNRRLCLRTKHGILNDKTNKFRITRITSCDRI